MDPEKWTAILTGAGLLVSLSCTVISIVALRVMEKKRDQATEALTARREAFEIELSDQHKVFQERLQNSYADFEGRLRNQIEQERQRYLEKVRVGEKLNKLTGMLQEAFDQFSHLRDQYDSRSDDFIIKHGTQALQRLSVFMSSASPADGIRLPRRRREDIEKIEKAFSLLFLAISIRAEERQKEENRRIVTQYYGDLRNLIDAFEAEVATFSGADRIT